MSQQVPRIGNLFTLEYPQSVGTYGTYDEAQHVVDFLADKRFPVENLCIVGTDLRSVERVLGRRSWATVMGAGVQSGLSTGLMITLLLWIVMPETDFLLLLVYAVAIGIFVGVIFAALGYWMSQGKRDFRSVSQTVATKYELLAEHKVAGQARELIGTIPGARAAQFAPPAPGAHQAQGQPYPAAGYPQPYQGQQDQGQPYQGQPYQGQPYQGQPYPGQPYPGQQYPGQIPPGLGYPEQQPPPQEQPSGQDPERSG